MHVMKTTILLCVLKVAVLHAFFKNNRITFLKFLDILGILYKQCHCSTSTSDTVYHDRNITKIKHHGRDIIISVSFVTKIKQEVQKWPKMRIVQAAIRLATAVIKFRNKETNVRSSS